jgi:fibronectin-binding autotransporter adhesin
VAIQPINSGYTSTLVVNTLTGTTGFIRTANSNTTVATGILSVGSGTYGGLIANANAITVNATLALIKTGASTLALTGTNTYTGGTTVDDGTLKLGNGYTSGSIVGNVALTNSSATLAFDRSNAYAFTGTISGNGNVSQVGTGTTTLSANHTYTGTTSVSAGTLVLSAAGNNIASSTVIDVGPSGVLDVSGMTNFTLASSQTLKGTGTIEGALNVGTGATLSAGNSPGTLTFNDNLTLAAGSTSIFEINGLTTGLHDLVQGGSGAQLVTYDGILNLVFQEGFATNGTVKIFDFDSYAGSFSAVNTSGLASGYSATFDALTGEVSVVPEPHTFALIGLGFAALLIRALYRKQQV